MIFFAPLLALRSFSEAKWDRGKQKNHLFLIFKIYVHKIFQALPRFHFFILRIDYFIAFFSHHLSVCIFKTWQPDSIQTAKARQK
jgi:hypothetical protein